jgi:hypothetical protein
MNQNQIVLNEHTALKFGVQIVTTSHTSGELLPQPYYQYHGMVIREHNGYYTATGVTLPNLVDGSLEGVIKQILTGLKVTGL